jgi:probable phosphoglycerate mutase
MKIALIPCGATEWSEQRRLLGRAALPLSERGAQCAAAWAAELAGAGLARIVHAPDELCRATAKLIAKRVGATTRADESLREVDLGLWSGLTEDEFSARYATSYRQLLDAPLSVSPPEGENISDAAERIAAGLRKRMRRNGGRPIGLVLRPIALSIARATLAGGSLSDLWNGAPLAEPLVLACEGAAAPASRG